MTMILQNDIVFPMVCFEFDNDPIIKTNTIDGKLIEPCLQGFSLN